MNEGPPFPGKKRESSKKVDSRWNLRNASKINSTKRLLREEKRRITDQPLIEEAATLLKRLDDVSSEAQTQRNFDTGTLAEDLEAFYASVNGESVNFDSSASADTSEVDTPDKSNEALERLLGDKKEYEPTAKAKLRASALRGVDGADFGQIEVRDDAFVPESIQIDPENEEDFVRMLDFIEEVVMKPLNAFKEEGGHAASKDRSEIANNLHAQVSRILPLIAAHMENIKKQVDIDDLENSAVEIAERYNQLREDNERFLASYSEKEDGIEEDKHFLKGSYNQAKAISNIVQKLDRADKSGHLKEQNHLIVEGFAGRYEDFEKLIITEAQKVEQGIELSKDAREKIEKELEGLESIKSMLPFDRGDEWRKILKEEGGDQETKAEEQEEQEVPAEEQETEPVVETVADALVKQEVPAEKQEAKENPLESTEQSEYKAAREAWKEAKEAHQEAQEEYRKAVAQFHEEQSADPSFFRRLGATLGFKKKNSPELEAMRLAAFEKTAQYNQLSQEVLAKRAGAGKSALDSEAVIDSERGARKEVVLARYQRMLARTTVTNTLDSQMAAERQALEAQKLGEDHFLVKNKKVLTVVGGGAVGLITGAGVFQGVARAVLGGVAGAGAVALFKKPVDDLFAGRMERITGEIDENVNAQLDVIQKKLTNGGMTAEELDATYRYLTDQYDRVDKETRKKIATLMGIAIGASLLVGDAIGHGSELFGGDVSTAGLEGSDVSGAEADGTRDVEIRDVSTAGPETSGQTDVAATDAASQPEPESSNGVAVEAAVESYIAEPGDNMWDIFEGQTSAEQPAVMSEVAPEHQQHLLKLVELHIDANPELRAELGFGETSHDLAIGAEVNLDLLNETARELAIENGFITEEVPVAEATPEVGDSADATEVADQVADSVSETTDAVPQEPAEVPVSLQGNEDAWMSIPNEAGFDRALFTEYLAQADINWVEFHKAFEDDFLHSIAAERTETEGIFSSVRVYDEPFLHFQGMTMEQFEGLQESSEAEVQAYLEENKIHPDDYEKWVNEVSRWEDVDGLEYGTDDNFGNVARKVYVLEQMALL